MSKPLPWRASDRKATCNLEVVYYNQSSCPFELAPGQEPSVEVRTDTDGVETSLLHCPLPALSEPIDCAEADALAENSCQTPGWFYCENNAENFEEACDPEGPWAGLDEDGDGRVDCDDPDCWRCNSCKDVEGADPQEATSRCEAACKFNVRLTDAASKLTQGRRVRLDCAYPTSGNDNNCFESETSAERCSDEIDNDGDGRFDCDDNPGQLHPHAADPNCCPMRVENGACIIEDAVEAICPNSKKLPDACIRKAEIIGCTLPGRQDRTSRYQWNLGC
jgi:hypothetical protein